MLNPTSQDVFLEVCAGGEVRVHIPATVRYGRIIRTVNDPVTFQHPPQYVPKNIQLTQSFVDLHRLDKMANLVTDSSGPVPLQNGNVVVVSTACDNHNISPIALTSTPVATASIARDQVLTVTSSPALPQPSRRQQSLGASPRARSTRPPRFPGYRWVAQTVALAGSPYRPLTQFAHVYDFMTRTWPGHFPASGRAWKSGVRHAVLKHFKRAPSPPGETGVWYQPDADDLMTDADAVCIVMGGRKAGHHYS